MLAVTNTMRLALLESNELVQRGTVQGHIDALDALMAAMKKLDESPAPVDPQLRLILKARKRALTEMIGRAVLARNEAQQEHASTLNAIAAMQRGGGDG